MAQKSEKEKEMKRRKKSFGNSGIVGPFMPALGLAGMSAGASVIGSGFANVPGGAGNALSTVGSETSKYVAPTAAIGMMGYMTKGLSKLNRKSRRRR